MNADIVTLERIVAQMKLDTERGNGLSHAAVRSIVRIIEESIGAPLNWPSRVAGVHYADDHFPGSPSVRAGFNAGVKWAVEHYSPTEFVENRRW